MNRSQINSFNFNNCFNYNLPSAGREDNINAQREQEVSSTALSAFKRTRQNEEKASPLERPSKKSRILKDELWYDREISCLAKSGQISAAINLLEERSKSSLEKNIFNHNTILGACVKYRDLTKVSRIIDLIRCDKLNYDHVTYTTLCNGSAKQNQKEKAEFYFKESVRLGGYSGYNLIPMLFLYSRLKAAEDMESIVDLMIEHKVPLKFSSAANLLEACQKLKYMSVANKIIKLIKDVKSNFQRKWLAEFISNNPLPKLAPQTTNKLDESLFRLQQTVESLPAVAAITESTAILPIEKLSGKEWTILPIPATSLDEARLWGLALQKLPMAFVKETFCKGINPEWRVLARQNLDIVDKKAQANKEWLSINKILKTLKVIVDGLLLDQNSPVVIYEYRPGDMYVPLSTLGASTGTNYIRLYKQLNSNPCHYDLLINYQNFGIPAKFQVSSSSHSSPSATSIISNSNRLREIKAESNTIIPSSNQIKREAISFPRSTDTSIIYIDCDPEEERMDTTSDQTVSQTQNEIRGIEASALFQAYQNATLSGNQSSSEGMSNITNQPQGLPQPLIKQEEQESPDIIKQEAPDFIKQEDSDTENHSSEQESLDGDQLMWWYEEEIVNLDLSAATPVEELEYKQTEFKRFI